MSTLQAIVLFAQEHGAAAHETDKTFYYVMGLGLGVFAVVVSIIGIKRDHSWPASDGAAKGIMALSAVLVLATMASAIVTS